MQIGIIGTGAVAQALAPKFAAAGHSVFLASRDPSGKSGLPAPVKGYDALADAEIIVVAVPGVLELDILKGIGAEAFRGKVVVDAGNAVDASYKLANPAESLAQSIQGQFPEARVVKAFNTYGAAVMTNPDILPARSNSFIAGDDPAAKAAVVELHKALGWKESEVIDLGGIGAALAQEHYFTMMLALAMTSNGKPFNVALVR